jgi:hypothetical protein
MEPKITSFKQTKLRFEDMPKKKWDGKTPLCLYGDYECFFTHGDDHFFENKTDVQLYCKDMGVKSSHLQLVICEPQYVPEVDPFDIYEYYLSANEEIPDKICDAFDELNKKIRRCKTPLSWFPGKYRTKIN